ncbi:hypothetical protein GWG65_13945 [Bradyrhizobium sp. CSA207]|uniref:hypothetical protein n=1 Tax=Bradyrhizobium sp. CSA207 TaxID=2698826 RepID=UPI0023B02339|nr:hypothetical protein [Bradyrhizobium sp. CSA207]MDE5442531.1 hypothetical protein [Bradyrhizobium sp. CSA207]
MSEVGPSDTLAERLAAAEPGVALRTLLVVSRGCSAAAPNRFCYQSALDVVIDRFDRDASRLAFSITLQLARVDKFVQLFSETWIALIA